MRRIHFNNLTNLQNLVVIMVSHMRLDHGHIQLTTWVYYRCSAGVSCRRCDKWLDQLFYYLCNCDARNCESQHIYFWQVKSYLCKWSMRNCRDYCISSEPTLLCSVLYSVNTSAGPGYSGHRRMCQAVVQLQLEKYQTNLLNSWVCDLWYI